MERTAKQSREGRSGEEGMDNEGRKTLQELHGALQSLRYGNVLIMCSCSNHKLMGLTQTPLKLRLVGPQAVNVAVVQHAACFSPAGLEVSEYCSSTHHCAKGC